MRRRSVTTGLMVDVSQVLQETVDVLSDPDQEAVIVASGHDSRRFASWRKRVESSRSELVRFLSGLISYISAGMI